MSVSPAKLDVLRANAEGNAIDASNDLLTFGVGPEYGTRHTLVETKYLQKLREALARVEELDQQTRTKYCVRCEGTGEVIVGSYTNPADDVADTCRSCNGTGLA